MKILVILLIIVIIFFLGITILGWIFSVPGYRGPISDHFDGKKFINPGGVQPLGFKDLYKWFRTRQRGEWTELKDIPYGPAPSGKVEGDSIVVTFINHSTFLIQTLGINILTDPVWCERAGPANFLGPKRMRPPGLFFEDLPEIDIILLTHNHYDHLDIGTMKKLADKYAPKIFCPLGVGRYLEKKGIRNITEMDWWDETSLDTGLSIICTPAQHFSGRGMFDRDRTLWSGFALMTAKGSIYYSGDTGYGDLFTEIAQRISPVRLSFLPIGAYKPAWFMSSIHTSPEDAVKIHHIIKSPKTIGMHYGTFPLADDGMEEPVKALREAMEREGMLVGEFMTLTEGKAIILK